MSELCQGGGAGTAVGWFVVVLMVLMVDHCQESGVVVDWGVFSSVI